MYTNPQMPREPNVVCRLLIADGIATRGMPGKQPQRSIKAWYDDPSLSQRSATVTDVCQDVVQCLTPQTSIT